MKRGTVYTSVVGILAAGLLMSGCASSQKPAALGVGATGVSGGASGGGGSATTTTSGASPSAGSSSSTKSATGGATSSASSSSGGGAGSAPTFGGGAAPGVVVTTTVDGGIKIIATVPSDPNASAAVAAFQGYTNVDAQMMMTSTFNNTGLAGYADLAAFAGANSSITFDRDNNVVYKGTQSYTTTVSSVQMNATPMPSVYLSACVDSTNWKGYFTSGAKKGEVGYTMKPARSVIQVTVHRNTAGHWLVTDITGKGTPC